MNIHTPSALLLSWVVQEESATKYRQILGKEAYTIYTHIQTF
jgi:hypothetical protein